jgi:hypothetical protein
MGDSNNENYIHEEIKEQVKLSLVSHPEGRT